jgi:hypothetical protein
MARPKTRPKKTIKGEGNIIKEKLIKEKCTCHSGHVLLSLIFFTLGLFGIFGGFFAQGRLMSLNKINFWDLLQIFIWYFIGILLIFLGKMSKYKAAMSCRLHEKTLH